MYAYSSLLGLSQVVTCYILLGLSVTKGAPADISPPCPPPPTIAHGFTNSQHNDYVIYYFCDWGYVLYGVESLHCGANGEWSDPAPVCVATSGCRILPRLNNGHKSYGYKGGVAFFGCNAGYTIHGPSVIYCNGKEWNAPLPDCKPKMAIMANLPVSNCPRPPHVANATMEVRDLDVVYTCQGSTGPTIGSERLECGLDGQWKQSPVICARIGCTLPNEPTNGLIIRKFSNTLLEFRCYDNFVLQGPSIAFCNGFSWNITTPIACVPSNTAMFNRPDAGLVVIGGTRCMNPPLVRHSRLHYHRSKDSRGVLYWSVRYHCHNGYSVKEGDSFVYCSQGQWVGQPPVCLSINYDTQISRNLILSAIP